MKILNTILILPLMIIIPSMLAYHTITYSHSHQPAHHEIRKINHFIHIYPGYIQLKWTKRFHHVLKNSCSNVTACQSGELRRLVCQHQPTPPARQACLIGAFSFCNECVGLKNTLYLLQQCQRQHRHCPYLLYMFHSDFIAIKEYLGAF